jgi:hypothetical protein
MALVSPTGLCTYFDPLDEHVSTTSIKHIEQIIHLVFYFDLVDLGIHRTE